ncbi:MAG: hypothetical protein IT381_10635 [Deltaproteobacteria bacterium]|nr:hypothetical protein [Deltaproteobacteria bacterium]
MKRHAVLLVLLAACADATSSSGGPSLGGAKDTTQFPSAADLDKLRAREKPALKFAETVRDVGDWKLVGPLATTLSDDAALASTLWEKTLLAAVAKRSGLWTMGKDMQCAARELGRYYLEKNGSPPGPLKDFITGRCGSTGVSLQTSWVEGDPNGASDERLFEAWRDDVKKQIDHFAAAPRSIGVFYGRKGNKAVIFLASVERKATITPMSLVPAADGTVTVEGEVLQHYNRVSAHINRGEFSYADCTMDLSVLLPKFRFFCPADPKDTAAWIDVSAWEPGRYLGAVIAGVLALPKGTAAAPAAFVSQRLAAAAKQLSTTAAFLDRVNVVRSAAKLAPMELEEQQSALSAELAPFYFAAQFGEIEETISDKVALGVMAGWSVGVPIVDGDFTSSYLGGAKDPAAMVAALMARPHGRETLLKPLATRLAVGVLEAKEGASLGAIVASYVPSSTIALDKETDTFIDRVNAERKKRGKPEITAQTLVDTEESEVRQALATHKWTPRQALDRLLQGRVSQRRQGLRGWEMIGESTATLGLPAEILDIERLVLTIVVGKQRDRKGPWERVVALVTIEPE